MYHALIWLLCIEVLGLITLPIAFSLFRRLPDRGLALSKPLALLLSSYILWVVGLTQILPNARYTIIAILVVLALVSFLILLRRLPEIVSFLRREWLPLLTAELVFLALYFLWLSVVSHVPAINHTEKPMDFAFLNSILRSTHFPPEDPWLAGHSISYYHFGHFMMALLTKLTAIPSSISYNLSIALIPALVGAGAFSLVYNFIRLSAARMRTAILFALAAPLFIVLIGNLEGMLELVHARGWGSEGFWQWVSIKGLEGPQGGDPSIFPRGHWWWWHATRVIDTVVDGNSLDYTINEFPFFSFLLGDLHPHILSLPFLVLNLALGLNLFVSGGNLGLSWLRRNPWEALIITLSLGSLAFINIWDFPLVVAILVSLVLVKGYGDWGGQFHRAVLSSITLLGPVLAGAVLLYLPYYLTLNSQGSGVMPVGEESTRPLFFFLIWGLFLVLSGSFLLRQLWTLPGLLGKHPGALSAVLVITLLPVLLWVGWELLVLWTGWDSLIGLFNGGAVSSVGTVGARLGKLLPGLVIVCVALYSMLLRARYGGGDRATAFLLLLLAVGLYALVGAELFHLVDLFGNRMNTVFKLYYQAWLLLAIVSAYGLYYVCSWPMPSLAAPARALAGRLETRQAMPAGILERTLRHGRSVLGGVLAQAGGYHAGTRARLLFVIFREGVRYGWVALVVVLVLASLYYPVGAALDRTGGSSDATLDGLAFLQSDNSGEYEAIRWLRDEAPWGRIVEAVGGDFDPKYGRISSSTGLPTILGWDFHECQWRASSRGFRECRLRGSSKLLDDRRAQVEQIYRSNEPEQVRRLLDVYDIRYVYVGRQERAKYGTDRLDKFGSFLKPVREFKDVVIYERLLDGKPEVVEQDDGGAD